MNFSKILEKLTPQEKLDLINQIKSSFNPDPLTIRQTIHTPTRCPKCGYTHIVKFGSYDGKRRFRCKSKKCGKTFTDTTGTSICYIKKIDQWTSFIDLMLQDKTIREIRDELHLSMGTVFSWRHKVLSSFEETFTKRFKGIVEMDDVYFNLNQKGRQTKKIKFDKVKRGISNQQVSVMITMDRYKTSDMKVTKLGRISKEDLDRVIDKKRLNEGNIVCSDSHPSIISFVGSMGLEHQTFISKNKTKGVYHVQNVNNQISGFRRWVKGNFNNVSTKYLQNYLYFYQMKEVIRKEENKGEEFLKFSLVDDKSFVRNRKIEDRYQTEIVGEYEKVEEKKEMKVRKVRNREDYVRDLFRPKKGE